MTQKYKNIILDDSVLDVDSWLPQSAIDSIVTAIIAQEKEQQKGDKKMTNSIFDLTNNQLPPYDLLSPTTTTHYISGRLSHKFKKYIPVTPDFESSQTDINTIRYHVDLTSVYGVIMPLDIPVAEEYSLSGDLLAKPTISSYLKKLMVKVKNEYSQNSKN